MSQSNLTPHQVLNFGKIHLRFHHFLNDAQVMRLESRDSLANHHLRLAEEIPLKIVVSELDRLIKILSGFHLLRQHPDAARCKSLNEPFAKWGRGAEEIHLMISAKSMRGWE